MKIARANVGAVVLDSLPFSMGGNEKTSRAWKARGVACFVGYLGAMNAARLAAVLAAGLAFMPVTFAGEYKDGAADELAQLAKLGIPKGATVWLDLEGTEAFRTDPIKLAALINGWADAIAAAGYQPGLYIGVPQPFTSDELYKLRVVRYWRGQGSIRDRRNALAEPYPRGWCLDQKYPSQQCGGVLVDFNMVGEDYRGGVPSWVVSDDPIERQAPDEDGGPL